ncbi:MAG: hypothetical protein M1828_000016 [Chrysothrix sp. TS-e1954]|nr:MAG: hypothetical protein M1828_000016 [Chrysothrix sp. TS-e1954]
MPLHFTMRGISKAIIIALISSTAESQLLNYASGDLPACARNCGLLNQAQTACVPPAAAKATQQQYESCFCQSAYLTPLKSSPNLCQSVCTSASDNTQIQSWYSNLCSKGVGAAGGNGAAATPTAAAVTASSPPTTDANGVSEPNNAGNQGNAQDTTATGGVNVKAAKSSWWSQHGKWVAMVIVLIVAFTIIIIIGVIWKKRYNRKRNRATATPLPVAGWGPNVNPHSYPGVAEKGGADDLTRQPSARRSAGNRLKKLVGR